MTTYARYATGETNVKHGTYKGKTLVLGWLVNHRNINTDERIEVLYALHVDGRVLESEPIATPNHDFNRMGRKWSPVDHVPDDAEFIGNYPANMF